MSWFDSKMFDNCEWCNGGGKESDGHYHCPDCEGTGMKGGLFAIEKFDEYVEYMQNQSLDTEKEVLWENGATGHGSSTSWVIFKQFGKIFVDGNAGWVSELTLNDEGVVKANPVNPIPKYIKNKAKKFLNENSQ